MKQTMSGPVIIDLMGPELSAEEREILQHPLVGGVILFDRHYIDPKQITHLCQQIRKSRRDPLLITVDQEGGRVQRFQKGFTRLPPMETLGVLYDENATLALQRAEQCGWLMASELLAVGVDLSFAPVLDLNKGLTAVTRGGRAFHEKPHIVAKLAKALIRGMHKAGMASTGKHFPGHGTVTLDSHLAMPTDERDFKTIAADDLIPFAELVQTDLDAVMPAHILFSAVDDKPVGFSEHWLKKVLRQELQFQGIVFSDDLNMEGAGVAGDYEERASSALNAGCDLVLICNNRVGAIRILDRLPPHYFVIATRMKALQGKFSLTLDELKVSQEWKRCHELFTTKQEIS